MLDVVLTQLGPEMGGDAVEWVFRAAILDGSQRHELSIFSLADDRFSDVVRRVIAEAFRLGKEAR